MNKKITFITDYFLEDCFGGAELVDHEIIKGLLKNGYDVLKVRCQHVKEEHLKGHIIISNFATLPIPIMRLIVKNCRYSIVEHDHKYVLSRNVALHKDYMVPPHLLVNQPFYQGAVKVFCQAKSHAEVVTKNLKLTNVVNLSTSIWSDEELDILEKNSSKPKNGKTMVLGSPNEIKNTPATVKFCEENGIDYEVVGPLPWPELMSKMAEFSEVLFLPTFLESFNRFIVEAKMLGCRVKTNNKNGCTSEDWFKKLSGLELISFMRDAKKTFISKIIDPNPEILTNLPETKYPLVSIITSKFKGEDHIESFLENITSQSVFNLCELIIVDPTPGNPCSTILEYQRKYDNIIYSKIEDDPGIYGCWNIAIGLSKGKYITNANLDDRRADIHIDHHVNFLENNEGIDLVYSEAFVTHKDFESFYENSSNGQVYPITEFSKKNMQKCLPGCMPVWRKSMHDGIGLFDSEMKMASDWEMWLRAVQNGSKFAQLPGVYGMYYMNPSGLSTNPETLKEKQIEEKSVFDKYKHIFRNQLANE